MLQEKNWIVTRGRSKKKEELLMKNEQTIKFLRHFFIYSHGQKTSHTICQVALCIQFNAFAEERPSPANP